MLAWLSENWANILTIALLVLIVGLIVFRMVRSRKAGKRPCGCDCAVCGTCCACKKPAAKKEP